MNRFDAQQELGHTFSHDSNAGGSDINCRTFTRRAPRMTMETPPKRSDKVFCAAKARAIPPMSSPVNNAETLTPAMVNNAIIRMIWIGLLSGVACNALFARMRCLQKVMVARAGVQPATFALGVRRSMQLSYRALSPSVSRHCICPWMVNLRVESLCLRYSVVMR